MGVTLARINGLLRQVTNVVSRGDQSVVDCIVSHRVRNAEAGKRPGAGWNSDPSKKPQGAKTFWIKHEPIVERVTVSSADLIDSDDWPVGLQDGQMPKLVAVIEPHMRRAVDSGNVQARRVMPAIKLDTVMGAIKMAGLYLPNDDEFQAALKEAWDICVPKGRVGKGKADAIIVKKVPRVAQQPDPPKQPAPTGGEAKLDDTIESSKPTIPEGHYWSAQLKVAVEDNEHNHLVDQALENGWPYEKLEGAEKRKKGPAGFTLQYASKKAYDPAEHGVVSE